jgi:hypothetical protein
MKRIIRLTESDLTRIVRRVINEQASNIKFGQPVIELFDQTYEGVKKTFTGNFIALNNGSTDFTLTKDMFALPDGGSVPDQVILKARQQTNIPFTFTLDPANRNQASIFRFLKQKNNIELDINVQIDEEGYDLMFIAEFTTVSGINESYRRRNYYR